jgi:hypothetical protein
MPHEPFGSPHVLVGRQSEHGRDPGSGAERADGAVGVVSLDDVRQDNAGAEATGKASGDCNGGSRLRRAVDTADDRGSPRRFRSS